MGTDMADEYREIEIEIEAESPFTVERLMEEVNAILGASWNPSTGLVTQTRKVEVGVNEADEDGSFGDPLTEEGYVQQMQEDLLSELRDAIQSAVKNV